MLVAGLLLSIFVTEPGNRQGSSKWSSADSEFAQQWHQYSPNEREEALRNYQRHEAAPERRQREVEQQYERWQTMPDEQRDKLRRNYDNYRNMPPAEQREVDRRYNDWKHRGRGK